MPNRLLPWFFIFSSVLCASLCFWQLQRYDEKNKEEIQKAHCSTHSPISIHDLAASPGAAWSGSRLCVYGQYDSRFTFLWDNLIHQGQAGYGVLNLLELDKEGSVPVLLVHRGWIARVEGKRDRYPPITIPTDIGQRCGILAKPVILPFLSNTFEYPLHEGMNVILDTNTEALSQTLNRSLYPWVLYLDSEVGNELTPLPLPSARMPPARHLGYALQWALLALVSILFAHRTAKKLRNL